MEKTRDYTELVVWKKAHEFVLSIYRQTKDFPKEELYGLTSQFRRAAVSTTQKALAGLIESGIVEKTEGHYFIGVPFFKRFITHYA
jgi:hypothetical protein